MTPGAMLQRFTYRAAGPDGRAVHGELTAADLQSARRALREQGLYPLSLKEGARPGTSVPAGTGRWVTAFSHHLADLLESGLDLDRALGALIRMAPGRWQQLLLALRAEVQGGAGLADALAHFPGAFPPANTGLIRAGEAAGNLETVLRRLAVYREEEEHIRTYLRTAMVYPAVVVVASVGAAAVMLGFVVPRFAGLFRQFRQTLPWPTRLIMALGTSVAGYWPVWLLGAAGVVGGGWAWSRSEGGRRALTRLLERLPGIGTIRRDLRVARFARSAAMLLGSGLTLSRALGVLVEAEPSPELHGALVGAREKVEGGRPLAGALAEQGVFPALAVEVLAVGEETGNLERAFTRVAELFGGEAQERTRRLLALVEPLLILAMAGLVGLMVAAMLLPVLSLPALGF